MKDDPLLQSGTDYAVATIRHVIETFGPRAPGSQAEREAQEFLKGELETCTDGAVEIEPFDVHQKAFMGFVPVAAGLMLLGVVLYWILPWGALACSAAAAVVVLFEFVMYKRFLDPLFPKQVSHNVVGIRKPSGDMKRRLILCGHCDAAYEWRYALSSVGLLKLVVLMGTASALSKLVLDAGLVAFNPWWEGGYHGLWLWVGIFQFCLTPAFVALLFFTDFSVTVPGANDDLTGALVTVATAKYLKEAGIAFEHTELRFLITGSEEAGLRGAKAYTERHRQELTEIETVFLALETFRDLEHLAVCRRDMSGTVRHDPRVCTLLHEAGKRCGRNLISEVIYLGSSDAAAFTQAGIPASALAGMDPAPPQYYHTRLDDADNLNPDCIRAALAVALEAVKLYDEHGLGA